MGQRDFVNRLLSAQTEVQESKNALAIRVAGAKSALLNRRAISPNTVQQAAEEQAIDPYDLQDVGANPYDIQQSVESSTLDVREDILRDAYTNPLQPDSPIIAKTPRGANIHADGTYSVVTPGGKIHAGLTHEQADRYSVYSKQEVMEEATEVPESFIPRKIAGMKDQLIDIDKGIIQGTLMGGDGTTLEEQVQARNNDITSQYEGTEGVAELKARTDDPRAQTLAESMGTIDKLNIGRQRQQDKITPAKPLITAEQVEEYKRVKDTVNFETATPLFKELRSLERFANWNKMIYERSEKVAAKLKSIFPASYKDQMAAKAGYDAVAEDKGTWEAIKYTFDNDLGTLLSSGIDSTPWMVAYTIGGPITQTAILTTLARSKGLQGIEEFKTKYGRNPDAQETQRIKLWQALGSIAEKYGDLSALKAFKANPQFLNNVKKALTTNTTTQVLALPSIAAIRVTGALGGEAISGGLTSYSEQMAEYGEVRDPATIGYDMLAEAAGTPGGMATMYLANTPFAVAEKQIADRAKNEEELITSIQQEERILATLTAKQKSKEKFTKRDRTPNQENVKQYEESNNKLLDKLSGYEAPFYENEDQIPIDENGEYVPTTNIIFNKIYNKKRTEGGMEVTDETGTRQTGLEWKSALAETERDMQATRDEINNALADIDAPYRDEDSTLSYEQGLRQLKRNTKRNIERFKQDLEERKFANRSKRKRVGDLKENVPPRTYKSKEQKAEEAELEAAETEAEQARIQEKQDRKAVANSIREIEKSKASNVEKIAGLQTILDSTDIPIGAIQASKIKRLIRKYAPVETTEDEESESFLQKLKKIGTRKLQDTEEKRALGTLEKVFSEPEDKDNTQAYEAKLNELKSKKLNKADQAVINSLVALRTHFNKLRSIGRRGKTFKDVNQESLFGTAHGYVGFSTYREKILELYNQNLDADDDTIARNELLIESNLISMRQHLTNLKNKLAAFKKAQKTSPKKRGKGKEVLVPVVRGIKNEEESAIRGGSVMEYTIDFMTDAKYRDLRDNSPEFVNRIHDNSKVLLDTIQTEINYGEKALFVAEEFNSTSFFEAAKQRADQLKQDSELADQITTVEKQADISGVEDITDEDIAAASIVTPSPGTTTTDVVAPEYANQTKSKEGIQALLGRLSEINIRVRIFNTQSKAELTPQEDAELSVLVEEARNIKTALASVEQPTTPTTPVAPSPEGREGATVEETTPPEIEEVIDQEAVLIENLNKAQKEYDDFHRLNPNAIETIRLDKVVESKQGLSEDRKPLAASFEKRFNAVRDNLKAAKEELSKFKKETEKVVETETPPVDDFFVQERKRQRKEDIAKLTQQLADLNKELKESTFKQQKTYFTNEIKKVTEKLAKLRQQDAIAEEIDRIEAEGVSEDLKESKIREPKKGDFARQKKPDRTRGTADVSKVVNVGDYQEKYAEIVDVRTGKDGKVISVSFKGSNAFKTYVPVDQIELKPTKETKAPTTTPTPAPTTDVTVEYQGRNYTVKGIGEKAQIVNDKGEEVYKASGDRPRILGEAAIKRGTAVEVNLGAFRYIVTIDKDGNLRAMNGGKITENGEIDKSKTSYGNIMKWGPNHGNIKELERNAAVKALRKGTNEIPTVEGQTTVTAEGQESEGTTPVSETTPPVTEPSASDTTQDGDTEQEGPAKRIPELSRSKQAFRIVFPKIITKEGALESQTVLAKNIELVKELAAEFGIRDTDISEDGTPARETYYDEIIDALDKLPDSRNYLNETVDTAPTTLTEKIVEKLTNKGKNQPESILGIVGKKFIELIKVSDEKGIHTIPNFVFNSPALLRQALDDLFPESDTKAETIDFLVKRWKSYKTKYVRVAYDDKNVDENKEEYNYAAGIPLSILNIFNVDSKKYQLPNSVVFMMMVHMNNFIQQRGSKGTRPFMNSNQMEQFLYNGNEPLSENEIQQLNNLGFNYTLTANQIGTQILKGLKFSSKLAPEYEDKLKTALGMQALQVDHGIFDINTADKSDGEQRLTISDLDSTNFNPSAPYQIEIYTWNFDDPWNDRRNYNNPDTKKNNIGKYRHIRFNDVNPVVLTEQEHKAITEANKVLKLGLDEVLPLQEPQDKVNTFIRKSISKVPAKVIKALQKKQRTAWSNTEAMPIIAFLAGNETKRELPDGEETSNRDIIDRVLGVDKAADDENTHKLKRESLTSSNRTTLANFNNTLRAFTTGNLKKFFVTYRLQNQLRYLMEGPVNPQQDKNVRHLVKSFDTGTYTKENLTLFQLAVAYNFGVKIDKNNLPYVIKQFNSLVKDPDVLAAVQLLNKINNIVAKSPDITEKELNKNGLLDKFADSLIPLKLKYSANIELISGITALSKYMTVTGTRDLNKGPQQGLSKQIVLNKKGVDSFKSDVMFEIDGISNGFAITVLQFPNFQQTGNLDELKKVLTRVGIRASKEYNAETEEIPHDIYSPDSYETLASLVKKYSGLKDDEGKIAEYLETREDVSITADDIHALHKLYPDLINEHQLRDLVKYPFLIYLYGGGIKSISRGVAKEMYRDFIEQLDTFQKQFNTYAFQTVKNKDGKKEKVRVLRYAPTKDRDGNVIKDKDGNAQYSVQLFNRLDKRVAEQIDQEVLDTAVKDANAFIKDTWAPFIENLRTVNALTNSQTLPSLTRDLVDNKTQTLKFQEKSLIRRLGELLQPRLDTALNEMLGVTEESRKAVIWAGELLNAMFIVKFNKLYAAHLKETGRDYLTEKEINNFIRNTPELNDYYPELKISLAYGNSTAAIDLTSRELTDEKDKVGTVEFHYTNKNGKKQRHFAETRRMKFTLPGPAALTRSIMNIDAAAMTLLLADTEITTSNEDVDETNSSLLGLHDGTMGQPETLVKGSKKYGEGLHKLNKEYSLLDTIFKLSEARWEKLEDDEKIAINEWLKENGWENDQLKKQDKEPKWVGEDILDVIHEANEKNNTHRENLYDLGIQAGQHMYVPTQSAEEIKRIAEELGIKIRLTPIDKTQTRVDPVLENPSDTLSEADEQSINDGTKKTLGTLEDLPRKNITPRYKKAITKGSVKKLFNDLKQRSQDYYNSAAQFTNHSGFLEDLVDVLEEAITSVARTSISYEDIDGVTQGRFDPEKNNIRISFSRQGPAFQNSHSPQEAYVHELLHAMSYVALRDNPQLEDEINKVFNKVKNSITYKTFLPKGITPTTDDTELARDIYDYIFNFDKNEENRLDEFLAYGLTNPGLIDHLRKIPSTTEQTLLDRLLAIFQTVINAFKTAIGKKVIAPKDSSAYAELFAIAEKIVAVHNKHQSHYINAESKIYSPGGVLDQGDKIVHDFHQSKIKSLIESAKKSKFARVTVTGIAPIYILLSQNALAMKLKAKLMEALGYSLRSVLHEVSETGSLNKDYVDQLLEIRNLIAKARFQVERWTQIWFHGDKTDPKEFPGIWKSFDATKPYALKVRDRVALTTVLFRTDLSNLLKTGLSHAQIGNLINNPQAITTEKTKIIKQLGKFPNKRDALFYARDLGYWMSVGLHKVSNGHTNVHSIAQDYKITDENKINLLDAFATLVALEYAPSDEIEAVRKLVTDEFNVSPKENAIIDLLDTHLDYVDTYARNEFKNNPNQMVKGYIVERVDDLTSLATGNIADKKRMSVKGFRKHIPLTKIPGVPSVHDTLYVSYNDPDSKDQAGLVPTTNKRNMGTTLTEILSEHPKFQTNDKPDYKKIAAKIAEIKKREAKKPLTWTRETTSLAPLRDDKGNIKDYRVMLSHKAMKNLLRPDLQIQNVLGHMRSQYIDRKNSLREGKRTIDLVVNQYNEEYNEDTESQFIDLLDPTKRHFERFKKLPRLLRDYILEYSKATGGEFLVKEDVADKVFGYKPINFSDTKMLQGDSITSEFTKHWVHVFHMMAKEIAGYGKDRIVIGMPEVVITNLISNVFRLSMGKIPPSYIEAKVNEGVREYFKYRDLQRERFRLQNLKNTRKLGENSPEAKELRRVIIRIKRNKIHELSEAGVNSLIVEDLNDAQIDGYINKARRLFKSDAASEYVNKVPAKLLEAGGWLYFTKGMTAYKHARTLVQLTDFISRYVMVNYDVDVRGMPFHEAKHKSIDSFVLFDEALVPALEMIDSIGATSFISYFLRNQRSATQAIKASPTSVGVSAVIQNVTGIPTLANLNSAWVAGDIEPNLFQFDELLDEATNATGFEIVSYFGDIIDEILD